MEWSVGSGAADQRLEIVAPSYLTMPKHGCSKNSDLILQLLQNFPSLTSFDYCNSTSQSKKPWNKLLLYVSPRARAYYNVELLYFFVISVRPSFPTDEGCISVGFIPTFFLKRGLNAGTQVGAVGAQHFQLGLAHRSHQGGRFHGFKNPEEGKTQLMIC